MKPTLTMTKGLPASGKTTWAKEQKAKRVNKDDLRAMLDNGEFSRDNEFSVLEVRNELVCKFLSEGHDVIVDDTNLHPKHEKKLRELAKLCDAEFEIKDFTDVPLNECLRRNARRATYVPDKAIIDMHKSFIAPNSIKALQQPVFDPDKPYCIIVDIDGTLAHMNGRGPYDYSKVGDDNVDEIIKEIVLRYAQKDPMSEIQDTYIVLMSGRDSSCRKITEEWLTKNNIPYDELYMRAKGDNRKDAIVKKELYDNNIAHRYNVRFILDDRDQVVEMWRENGLRCLQVAPGNF